MVQQLLKAYDGLKIITGVDPEKQTPESINITKVLAEGIRRLG